MGSQWVWFNIERNAQQRIPRRSGTLQLARGMAEDPDQKSSAPLLSSSGSECKEGSPAAAGMATSMGVSSAPEQLQGQGQGASGRAPMTQQLSQDSATGVKVNRELESMGCSQYRYTKLWLVCS